MSKAAVIVTKVLFLVFVLAIALIIGRALSPKCTAANEGALWSPNHMSETKVCRSGAWVPYVSPVKP